MGLYKEIMEAAEIVRKDDNLDLYKKLLDLSSQALDMQDNIFPLIVDGNSINQIFGSAGTDGAFIFLFTELSISSCLHTNS